MAGRVMDAEILTKVGVAGFLILLVAWLVRFMAMSAMTVWKELVTGVKEFRQDFQTHTARDMEHHADTREAIAGVREEIVRLQGQISREMDLPLSGGVVSATSEEVTPIEGARRAPRPQEWPSMTYGVHRNRDKKEK